MQLAAQVAVPAGRHRPVAAGTLVDTWWFITIITWFTRLGVDTWGHPCCCERIRSQGLGLWFLCLEQWDDLCSCGAKGQSWKRSRTPEECSRSLWPVYWMSYLRDIYWFIGSFTHCTALDSQNFGIRWIVKVVKSFQLSELSRPVIQSCKGNQEDCPGPGFHELTALQSQSAWGELSGPSCAMLQMFRGWECASSQKMSEVLRQFQVIRAAGDRGCGPKAVKASFYRSDQSWAFSELNGFAVSPRLHHSRGGSCRILMLKVLS